jgi:hypothetical protein
MKKMRVTKQAGSESGCGIDEQDLSTAGARRTWTRPALRRMVAGTAEIMSSNQVDAEGMS